MNKTRITLLILSLTLAACAPAVENEPVADDAADAVMATETLVPTETPIPATDIPPTPTTPPTATREPVAAGSTAGETRVDAFGIEQVWVPAGSFIMGSDAARDDETAPTWAGREPKSEGPEHEVTLTQGYWLDKHEVTNANYQAFMDAGGYENPALWSELGARWLAKQVGVTLPATCTEDTAPDMPQVCVTWYEAEAYANWRGGRLPTEAEWEYAARGPESNIYPWGNTWDSALSNIENSTGLAAVGSFPEDVSWVGALDMAGNAMEWVNNWLDWNYYKKGENIDPQGPATGTVKLEKGGWWGGPVFAARASYHHFEDNPMYQDYHIGIRLVISPDAP